MKLLIRNLSRKTTQAELKAIFEEIGVIDYCTLVLDKETGKSKGFAFVEMPNEIEAITAISTLDASRLKKNKIRVKAAD